MKRLTLFLFVLVFITPSILTGQTIPEVDVEGLEYPELNPYQIPDIEIFELDNGITFYLVEDDEVPLINLNVIVRAGSFMDPDDKVGLASVTANVMRNGGSEAYPEDELNQLLEDRAARLEFGMGFTSGSASLNSLKEDFSELLPVLVDVMLNPKLPQEKIDLAVTQRRSGIARRNDDAQQVGFREFERLIYGEGSPQGRMTEHRTLDAISRDDLIDFHSRAFTGNNLMIGLAGDFNTDEIKPLLEEIFSAVPAGVKNEITLPEVDYEFDSSIHFVDKRDVNQSVILMGHIGGLRDNPDYAALQAMNEVLSGGFSGRLFQNVRSDQGLAYAVFGNYSSNALYSGQFFAGVFTQSSSTAEAIEAVRREMIRLQEEAVDQEELDDTRNSILNSLVFRYDSRSRVLRERMSNEYLGLPADAFESYIEELQALEPADIQRVAQQYMRPNEMRILVVGNGEEIGDQLDQFGEVNEVDISIPLPGDDEEMAAGDAEAGKEWLGRMAAAVLPDGAVNGDLVFVADNTVQTPQGEMVLGVTQTINFDSEKLISVVNSPMGEVTMQIEDGEGKMVMGGNEMPMPPAQKEQVLAELYRNHIYLAINRDQLDVEYIGEEEIEGNEYIHIRINEEITLNLFIDPETGYPVYTTYRQLNPQTGGQMDVKVVSGDWQESDGVVMPYESVVYSDEELTAKVVVSSHSVE